MSEEVDEAAPSQASQAVLIIGMHRSGTSLVAQACAAAGISAGAADDMLAAQEDNPEGFYEHRRLVAINDALLGVAGGAWSNPLSLPGDAWPETQQASARALLQELAEFGKREFLLKDPRLCLTARGWLQLLPTATVIFVYRDALSVARSLQRRNGFPLQHGLLLWEFYNRAALDSLQGLDFIALDYDALLDDSDKLRGALAALKQRGLNCDPDLGAAVVDPSLRRSSAGTDAGGRALLTRAQRELEETCATICTGEALQPVPVMDERAVARLRDLAAALEPLATVVETGIARDEAEALCAERTRERDTALAEFATLDSEHRALASAHDRERQSHAGTATTLRSLQEEHVELAAAHQREVGAHEALVQDHASLMDLHELELRKSAELEEKAGYLFFALSEAYRGLLTFETSLLGRLQRWLRAGYGLLRGGRAQSLYDDVLLSAHAHFEEYELHKPRPAPGKLSMLGDVLRYIWQNPAGSARSFSWARLRRATSVFFGSSSADLAVWVNARFPDAGSPGMGFDPASLSADLDTLELAFPTHETPQVSIIIPVFNDYRVTVNCLRSIYRHTPGIPYEVILADDCSTDLTATISERVSGLRVIQTPENLRFLRNCNNAAAHARGAYLLFLNNDTAVTENWLEPMIRDFEDQRVGVVGPKLLFADGKLQEAGGIIWRDASGWNFGRGDDPAKPAYSYRREVDYVSGACLAIRASLWEQLGGFDTRFAPAYYEDADICFAAREAGFRVCYQPASAIYHFEGVSNGTDLTAGVKQHQVTNQQVFRDKWQATLDAEHFPNAEQVVHARDRSAGRPCVLVIDHYVPHYDRDAGGRSTQMYMELLLELGCRVQFMGANFFPHQPYTARLQEMGVEVLVGESIARNLDAWLAEHAPYIDEIMLHRPHVAEQFLPHLNRLKPRPGISFFGHDLHHLRIAREAALKEDDSLRREAQRWLERELAVFEQVERVYYFSDAELAELSGKVDADKLRRVPLYAMPIQPVPEYRPDEPHSLLFVGGYNHPPNVDAAHWLVEEILPALREREPAAHLHLVGSHPPQAVLDLAGEHVTVHGYLSDPELDALYRRVGVAVVPLRYGAGVKGKVIEAIRQGLPVVTTDIGAEGIPDADSVMSVANTASQLVDEIAGILGGAIDLSERRALYAQWLEAHFSSAAAMRHLQSDRSWMAAAQSRNSGAQSTSAAGNG